MHIVLFSPAWPFGYPNGIVSYVHYLRGGLEQLGHQVTIITTKIIQPCDDRQVHCIERSLVDKVKSKVKRVMGQNTLSNAWVPSAISRKLREIHARAPVDIFEMEESFGWFAQVAKRTPFPVVAKLHGPAFITQALQAVTPLNLQERIEFEAAALQSHEHICSPSLDTLMQSRRAMGFEASRAEVLVNPVECNISEDLIWNPGKFEKNTLLFVGRFDAHKGGDIMLLAFKHILKSRPDAQLIFVGPNSEKVSEEGALYDVDAYLLKHFSADERRHIVMTGPLKGFEINQLRTRAAVTVVASRWENQPNTLLEAMVQGCPVVASNTAGIPEIIHHGMDGLLADNADPASMAAACLKLMQDPVLSAQLGQEARIRSVARYNPIAVAQANIDYYKRTLSCKRESGSTSNS
jgi:glycosyltransferase involved in cell wall biosynthesis